MSEESHQAPLCLVIMLAIAWSVNTILHLVTIELIIAGFVAYKYYEPATSIVMRTYRKLNNKQKEKPNGY